MEYNNDMGLKHQTKTLMQHDEQEYNYKNTTKQYKNTTMTQLSTTRPILNAPALRLWVEKPCDPLQDLYHPKLNILYVVLQEDNTWNYRLPYNIYNVVCE